MSYNYKKNQEATKKAVANGIIRNIDKLEKQIDSVDFKPKKK